jgi:hypothetical protein
MSVPATSALGLRSAIAARVFGTSRLNLFEAKRG